MYPVILTTHSMEEADRIADRVMIMADGELKCKSLFYFSFLIPKLGIGVSAELKNRYGEGFKLAIQVGRGGDEEAAHEVHKL